MYRYKQKQNDYFQKLEEIKVAHNNMLLTSQIEMQEQTFQNISRNIHDNIGQKLSLAKLQLNTLPYNSMPETSSRVEDVVAMIGHALSDLSDISRSMSSEMILQNGLIKGLEFEVAQMKKTGQYDIYLNVTGASIFLNENTELVLFRLTQEILQNIIKHAEADRIDITLHFEPTTVSLTIADNGKGFDLHGEKNCGIGMMNMRKRVQSLKGTCLVESSASNGTHVTILIPTV